MAIENDCSLAMYNLGRFYNHIEKNNELSKKYYIMAIQKDNDDDAFESLHKITTPLERYLLFKENNIKFDEEMDNEIHKYKNKINKYSEEAECPVCLETAKCIPMSCFFHVVCINCYTKIYNEPCPVCRID